MEFDTEDQVLYVAVFVVIVLNVAVVIIVVMVVIADVLGVSRCRTDTP